MKPLFARWLTGALVVLMAGTYVIARPLSDDASANSQMVAAALAHVVKAECRLFRCVVGG